MSLPFPLLDPARRRAVVKAVEESLLTPVGLRSLAPGEPGYRPRYQGGPWERAGAYHQGAVWPRLLGPFVTAYLRAVGRSKKSVAYCRSYDAEPPHRPVGAPAQMWSIAELLRVWDVCAQTDHLKNRGIKASCSLWDRLAGQIEFGRTYYVDPTSRAACVRNSVLDIAFTNAV